MFPSEFWKFATEVAIRCGLTIDRTTQVERIDDSCRTQVEHLLDCRLDLLLRNMVRAERFDHDRNGTRDTDSISDLNLAAISKASCDHVLRDPACCIGARTINLRAVLARERTATMATHAAIGVNDDLTAGKARIAHRTTDHEATGRVDEDLGAFIGKIEISEYRRDDLLDDIFAQLLGIDILRVLGRNDDLVDTYWLIVRCV